MNGIDKWLLGIIFGFQFSVFNLLMGVISGYYFGRKIVIKQNTQIQINRIIKQVSTFTAIVMLLICIASAYIALLGEGIGKDLQMMFRLPFEVSKMMIRVIALLSGGMLISLQYIIANYVMNKTRGIL